MSTGAPTSPEEKRASQAETDTTNQTEAPAPAACQRERDITQLPIEEAGTTANLDDSSHQLLPNPDDRWITDAGPVMQLASISSLQNPNGEDSLFVPDSRSSVESPSLPPADVQMVHPDEFISPSVQGSDTSIQPLSFPPADVQMVHPDEFISPSVQGFDTSIQPLSLPPADVPMAVATAATCNQEFFTAMHYSSFQPADMQTMYLDGPDLEHPYAADLPSKEMEAMLKVLDGEPGPTTKSPHEIPVPMNRELDEADKNPSADAIADDENPRPSLDNMPVVSSASSGAVNADPQSVNLAHEGEEAEWLDDELDAIAQQDLSDAKFQAAKRHFQSLANPSMEDKIRLEAARMEDEARKRRVAAKEAFEAENQSRNSNYEDSGAISDEQVSVDVVAQSWKETVQPSQDTAESRGQGQQLRVPRNRKNRLSAEEKRKSKKYGFESVMKQAGQKTPTKSRKRKSEDAAPDSEAVKAPARKKARKNTPATKEFLKVLKAPNVIEDAHASASAQAMPEFSEKNKEKAFTQMIASIPAADLAEAKSDRNKIREASRRFRKIARLDGKGGYRIPGLKTSLYHYQLQGAAFMRDRENSSVQPLGGFLCDFMGFGKTIQALANIVDGRPTDPNDPIYTTLIIVPSPLVTHWNNQIINHCDGIDGSEVLTYDARTRLNTLDTAKSLQKYSVIITTYEEVRRSYPKCSKLSVPSGSQEEVSAWWDKHYEENVGPLHKIKFLRIILDEGHMIKNHASAVSIAVRALTGLYKWILTGTPIHNYLDELYPQFDFLGVPGTQDHEKFFKDFCRDENGHSRLVNLLRSFMFRRTHASRLFTFPIVKLPDVKDRTISVRFCDAERVIYNAIQDVFFERFNKCAEEKHPKLAQYRCSLTMILKLRMFCSHLLTAHDMIKALLSKGTLMSKLGRMSNQQKDPQDPSFIIIQRLISVRTNPTAISDKEKEHLGHSTSLQGDKEKLVKNYYEYMRRLHDEEEWDERLERNECPQCRSIPVYPVITSCHHLYCEECYSSLSVNESPGQDKPTCCTCQEPIQEAAYYDMDEELETQQTQREVPKTQSKRKGATKRKSQKSFRGSASINANMEPTSVSDADEETDWIQACAGQMPSAKLTKLRELIAQWLAESPKNKVVVFTQFLDFVRIMHIMCQTQGWSAACLTGKMNLAKREASMKQFSDVNGNTNIMLASLKAGGIGLDLTAANKCILIDLWWNEAIQDQAFCRLWRHGQTQEVEYVKLIVEDTIDDHLLNLQRAKMTEIDETIGDGVLEDRATMKFLLEMFADVEVEDNGIYRLSRKGTEKNKPRARSNGKGKKKQDDPPDESETES